MTSSIRPWNGLSLTVAILSMLTAMVTVPALAAEPATTPIPGDGRTADQLRHEVIERMRALRAWKIVDELKLDQATSARLFPILSKYDDRELALMKERHDVMRELRTEIEAASPNNTKLSAAIDRLIALRAKQRALQDEKIRDLRKALNPAQQAKLVLLLPRIERGFLHRIREVSEEQRRTDDGHDRRRPGPPPDDDYFDF
jgi:Spy/CpxP family protein refolding chaperone